MSFLGYIYIYLLGGITFIPLVVFLFIYLHPVIDDTGDEKDGGEEKVNVGEVEEKESSGLKTYKSGWITVTQDYIESIDDISSNTQSISESTENKSAYSSLYKLVKNTDSDSSTTVESSNQPIETKSDATVKKSQKKHRFYAVLKHGNLFLYKNESLKDVKHVIVLSNQVISVWPRTIPDGQLFTKTTAICIMKRDWSRKRRLSEEFENEIITTNDVLRMNLDPPSGSIFVYCDTNIEKEDWYFSLIKATKMESKSKNLNPIVYAKTLHFETDNMINLIQTLYSSEGQWHTKWLNAMIGRLFLSLQKTEFLKEFLKNRLNKKLNKIKTPGFLDTFKLVKLDAGVAAPFITWPSLREINPNGDLVVKLFLHYHGKLSFQISTKVNINLGSRFKPREVDLLLSITIEKLEGPMLIKFKPPPSERIWYSFECEPVMNLKIEPIISSRQLTYNIITNSIEKKLKEAIKDSLVLPHWDDFVFYNTTDEIYRGGIWDKDNRPEEKMDAGPLDIETSQQQLEEDAESISEGIDLPRQNTTSNLTTNKAGEVLPPVRSNTTNPKLRISNTLNDISRKMKKPKSNTTLSVNEDNYYSDGSFVESSKTVNHDLTDPNNNKKTTINTLKKLGKWYFKDEKQIPENENYTKPEMILSRRKVKKSGSDSTKLLQNSDLPSYEMFNKDLNSDSNSAKDVFNHVEATGRSRTNSKLSLISTDKSLNLTNDPELIINGAHENESLNIDIEDDNSLNLKEDSKVALSSSFSPTNASIVSEDLTEKHSVPHNRHRKPPPDLVPKTPPQLPPREINRVTNNSTRLNTSQDNKVNISNEVQKLKEEDTINEDKSNDNNDNDIDDLGF